MGLDHSLFSQSWYRVADLRPRLRSHVQILSHSYRGELWYILQDRFTGRHHRFSQEAYQVIGLLDGHRTLDAIWQKACLELGDHMPTQDELINLVSQLYRADLLQSSALPDFREIEARHRKGRKNRLLMNLRSPLSVRFPLLDPDRFLSATIPYLKPLLGWQAGCLWLFVVCTSVVLACIHWTDLTENVTDSLLSLENLFLITLLYPFLKVLHEFGHAYLVKKWGGEVHEMGVMFLVFMPIPYVDASSSLAFANKYKRMAVGAAGIMVEIFSAAVALLVWLNVEPGTVRAIAFNTMLIAGVSTLLFNGNPLLRFDAYYVLSDFLEIPNLGRKANKYVQYLCKRYLLGVEHEEPDTRSGAEAAWLVLYAVLSFTYRIFLSVRIILFVAGKFFFIGIILAIWAGYGMLVGPVVRAGNYLIQDGHMKRRRLRVFGVVVVPLCAAVLSLFIVPLPYTTVSEGVTWAPDESQIYAASDGFVLDILSESGSEVAKGAPLLQLGSDELAAGVAVLELMLDEYQARYEKAFQIDRIEAALIGEEIDRIRAELRRARERRGSLSINSPLTGRFILKEPERMLDGYVSRGTLLGYVIDQQNMSVRVVVSQADIDTVREDTRSIQVRFASNIEQVFGAMLVAEIPAASRTLPSMALSLRGGGQYALDPRVQDKLAVMENLFQFDLSISDCSIANINERVYVRFEHSPEPLAYRWYRNVRRLLLSRFAY